MTRSIKLAVGVVFALAMGNAGCAVQPASTEEVQVDTNGHVTASGVKPMLEVTRNPCAGTPQPWNGPPCSGSDPNGSTPVNNHAPTSTIDLGHKTLAAPLTP